MHSTTKRNLLQRAMELMGRDQLAARLGISETLLDAWIRGDVTMPDGKLLVLAAVLDEIAKPKK
jgi:DNA-binding transcriptional regulator YdaS (Cro superfamily)